MVDLGLARDDEDLIVSVLDDAFARCDAVLTSGGVSVGEYDYVKAALDRFGALEWRQVAIKPAKPLAFGVVRGVPVFGLPGNPVSSLVSFELFARPALLAMMGYAEPRRPEVVARAAHAFARRADGKVHLDRVRVRWEGDGYVVASTGKQESNVLSATAAANGLALVPDGDGVAEGDPVTVMLLDLTLRPVALGRGLAAHAPRARARTGLRPAPSEAGTRDACRLPRGAALGNRRVRPGPARPTPTTSGCRRRGRRCPTRTPPRGRSRSTSIPARRQVIRRPRSRGRRRAPIPTRGRCRSP